MEIEVPIIETTNIMAKKWLKLVWKLKCQLLKQVAAIETRAIYWNNNLLKQVIIIGTSLHRNECLQLKQLSTGLYGENTEVPKGSGFETRIHWSNCHLLKQGSIIETSRYWNNYPLVYMEEIRKHFLKQASLVSSIETWIHWNKDQFIGTWIHWNKGHFIETLIHWFLRRN